MNPFFTELKRRNVVRVALAYAVVSWVITQAADTLESVLLLPEWFTAAIVAALFLGFPVALIISWAYELTPQGLIPTAEVNATDSVIHKTAKRLDIVTIGVVCVAVVLMFVRPYIAPEGSSEETSLPENSRVAELIADADASDDTPGDNQPEIDAASIAVLPFINLSSDPEQEYFSDGISEELLNLFAKIPDLRVAARTSSFQFKDKNLDVPEIGKQLNVAHVLEGSVRKSGTTLRITAQLIEAASGFHLWSETYDRELVDIFAIQDEISMAIVEALSDILGVVSAADTPTMVRSDSTAAYEAYLHGNVLANRLTDKDLQAAQLQFDRAIELDPNFAPAYTGLAGTYLMRLASGSTYGTLSLAEVLTKATPLIERALELAPTLAAAHRRRGQLLNFQGRYHESVRSLRVALDFNPNDASIYNSLAINYQYLSDYDAGQDALEKGYQLDPVNPTAVSNLANLYLNLGQVDEAEALYRKLEILDNPRASLGLANVASERGQPTRAMQHRIDGIEAAPDDIRQRAPLAFYLAYGGYYEEAIELFPPAKPFLLSYANQGDAALIAVRQNLIEDPNNFSRKNLYADILVQTGNDAQAKAVFEEIDRETEGYVLANDTWFIGALNLVTISEAQGDQGLAEEILDRMRVDLESQERIGYSGAFQNATQARTLLALGDIDSALIRLKVAVQGGVIILNDYTLASEIAFRDLAEDPRLQEVFEIAQSQSDEVLAVLFTAICAQPPMEFWQPSEATCQRAAAEFELELELAEI